MSQRSQLTATRLRNRAYDQVYVQNNAQFLKFAATPNWFAAAHAFAVNDCAVFPMVRVDAAARRSLNRLARCVRSERAALLPAVAQGILATADDILLYRLLTSIESTEGRRRLARVWLEPVARHREATVGILSRLVEDRWQAACTAGLASPLDVSRMEDDTIPAPEVLRTFVTRYAKDACARRELLVETISGDVAESANAMLGYPTYLRQRVGRRPPVHLSLLRSIELIRMLIEATLDGSVEVTWTQSAVLLRLHDDAGNVPGYIQVDLCTTTARSRTACTESLVSTTGYVVGRVLARCTPSTSELTMTYESFFLFMHEIGHALTHVITAEHAIYRGPWSGLVYGQVVHTETISALTEKIALHPEIARFFRCTSPDETAALQERQNLRALEFLRSECEQVACARLDCALMSESSQSRNGLDESLLSMQEFEVWTTAAWQVVPFFLSQLFARHPGAAGVAYLVSNAQSCKFSELFRGESLETAVQSVATSVAEMVSGSPSSAIDELESDAVSAVYLPALVGGVVET